MSISYGEPRRAPSGFILITTVWVKGHHCRQGDRETKVTGGELEVRVMAPPSAPLLLHFALTSEGFPVHWGGSKLSHSIKDLMVEARTIPSALPTFF